MYANRAIAVFMVVFVALAYVPVSAEAATANMGEGMSMKLKRGVINTLTGVIEVPAQTIKGAKKGIQGMDDKPVISHPAGTVVGFFRGIHQGAGRTLSGVQDGVGFWSADHLSNDGYGIPLDAEYAWEEGTMYQMTDPNIVEGISPMGRKFVRGAGDAIFSPLEFPGHMKLGFEDSANNNPGSGILQGVYFSLSRLYTGGTDAVLFALPNPKDTVGNELDYAYPWGALTGGEKMHMETKETSTEMVQ